MNPTYSHLFSSICSHFLRILRLIFLATFSIFILLISIQLWSSEYASNYPIWWHIISLFAIPFKLFVHLFILHRFFRCCCCSFLSAYVQAHQVVVTISIAISNGIHLVLCLLHCFCIHCYFLSQMYILFPLWAQISGKPTHTHTHMLSSWQRTKYSKLAAKVLRHTSNQNKK